MSAYKEPGQAVVLNRKSERTVISVRRYSLHPVCCGVEGREPGSESHWGGEMRRVYTRDGGTWIPIGWVCVEPECRAFLADKQSQDVGR